MIDIFSWGWGHKKMPRKKEEMGYSSIQWEREGVFFTVEEEKQREKQV